MNLEKIVVPRPALDLGYESAHRAQCRPPGDLRRRSGVLRPSRRQGRVPRTPRAIATIIARPATQAAALIAPKVPVLPVPIDADAGLEPRPKGGAPSLEFSERVEPRFVTMTAARADFCAARQSKVRSGPPRGVGYADRQVVLARPLHRPLASSFGRPPSPTRNLSVHRPMNDSPEPHVFEEQRNKLRPDSHHDKAEP